MPEEIYECEARLFQTDQTTGKRGLVWVNMLVLRAMQMGDSLKRDVRSVMGRFASTRPDRMASPRRTLNIGENTQDVRWDFVSRATDACIQTRLSDFSRRLRAEMISYAFHSS
jgi:hypothetical protein